MSTVIMMFILPLGITLYFFDKKSRAQNQETFNRFVQNIKDSDLSNREKLNRIDEMYYQNGYKCTYKSEETLTMEKKQFNLAVALISLGLAAYVGIILYLIYFKFFLKPEKITITL